MTDKSWLEATKDLDVQKAADGLAKYWEENKDRLMSKAEYDWVEAVEKLTGGFEKAIMSKDEKSTYYDTGGIETLDIIKAKLTPEQYQGFLLGSALKYLCRVNFKHEDDVDKARDIEKAANYLGWLEDII